MLPFLKNRKISTIIIAKRKPEGSTEPMGEQSSFDDPALMSAAQDLISAVKESNASAVAAALKAAFEILDSSEEASGSSTEDMI